LGGIGALASGLGNAIGNGLRAGYDAVTGRADGGGYPYPPYAPDPDRNRLTLGFPRPTPPERLPGFSLTPPTRENPLGFPRPSDPTWQEKFDNNQFGTSNPPGFPSRSNDPLHYLSIEHNDEVFYDIGYGHASKPERMAEWAQQGIHNQQQLTEHLQDVATFPADQKSQRLDNGKVKEIYLGHEGTILIVNPNDPDGGTAFNPNIQKRNSTASRQYFDDQP
jgi:hypothetical protein